MGSWASTARSGVTLNYTLMALSSRGRALRWLSTHRGITEQPYGANWDNRTDGISAAIKRTGFNIPVPWCGCWFYSALHAGRVHGITSRLASVGLIEQDAKAHRAPFRGWIPKPARTGPHWKRVYRGDGVVMFGPGVHVETVRSVAWIYRRLGLILVDGGNTSSGDGGSQSNGGGSFRRWRRISDIWGLALVNYPDK